MPHVDRQPLPFGRLVEYFREAFKPVERRRVGMELEKMGVHAATRRPIPYEGPQASVRGVLEFLLRRRGGDPVYEGDHLIGIEAPWGAISLEPGGQVEWSSRPAAGLDALARDLDAHLAAMRDAGDALGIAWLDSGVNPETPVVAMPWMPKARYGIMREHLGARGRLAHRMMTQTASIQCAFDFTSEEDWSRKFRAAALMAPVATALFANSSRADGEETGFRSFRQAIWRETDPERCGLPAIVFEPGFDLERWTRWAAQVPTIFFRRGGGLVASHGEPFRVLADRGGCDAVTIDDWELHLSTIFTEVRSYSYLEARTADLQPDPLALAVPAFWAGLLYDPTALDAALALGAPWDAHDRWREAMERASREALEVPALRDAATAALGLAARGLQRGAAGPAGAGLEALDRLAARHALVVPEQVP
jgi:glutamate--cysteine ligase